MKLLSFFKLTYLLPSSLFLIICVIISYLISSKLYLNEFYSKYVGGPDDEAFVDEHLFNLKNYYIGNSGIDNTKDYLDKMIYIIVDFCFCFKIF